ncbi:MAG TPA: hypothetical protein VGL13_06330 [Polyangiaceae bacterium]|jgi:hypothetical protein
MEAWSRWPLGLSLALHAAVLGIGAFRPARPAENLRTDFWAGQTFEAPELVDEAPSVESDPSWSAGGSGESAPGQVEPTPVEPAATPARPRASSRPSTAKAAQAATPASTGAANTTENGGFGAEGAAPGVRDLIRSFVRAIPAAASSDPEWATLPIGSAGSTELTLVLDADLKPHAEALDPRVTPQLRRLIQKTMLVLSGGRFAVSSEGPATEKVHIAAWVTQLAVPPTSDGQSGGIFGLGFEPPNEQRVSRAFFTLASGRHVEVTVRAARAP